LKYKKIKKNHKKFRKSFFYKNWLETTEYQDAQECLSFFQKKKSGIVVVDHYGISRIWHKFIKKNNFKIIVIDDLADRKYNCDILLDSTPGRKKIEYRNLVNKECKLLVGSNNFLLRDEFINQKKKPKKEYLKKKLVKKVLISMGGSDLNNSSEFIIKNLEKANLNIIVTLIIGKNYKYFSRLKNLIKKFNTKIIIKRNVNNMAKLISENDLGITTPSVTAIEFCYMG
jgi:UDP-2,4-diacetamido-2,4,6-trideoxy-beta-L-altropyranose hydrolase